MLMDLQSTALSHSAIPKIGEEETRTLKVYMQNKNFTKLNYFPINLKFYKFNFFLKILYYKTY